MRLDDRCPLLFDQSPDYLPAAADLGMITLIDQVHNDQVIPVRGDQIRPADQFIVVELRVLVGEGKVLGVFADLPLPAYRDNVGQRWTGVYDRDTSVDLSRQ